MFRLGGDMVTQIRIRRVTTLTDEFDSLAAEAISERHGMVEKLAAEWRDGTNRFDLPGECLLAALIEGQLAGVGGINRDPYTSREGVGRLRHLYVARSMRRMGVAKALVTHLLTDAGQQFSIVRLRTLNPEADAFYREIGFVTCVEPDATHQIVPNRLQVVGQTRGRPTT